MTAYKGDAYEFQDDAKTTLHRAWLSGHNYCKWGWKADKELEAASFFDHIQS